MHFHEKRDSVMVLVNLRKRRFTKPVCRRVQELHNQEWALLCDGCQDHVSLKRSVIKNHIQLSKHKKSKEQLRCRESQERDIASHLMEHNEEVHLQGETLPTLGTSSNYLLKAGVPLSKDILETQQV